MTALRCKDCPIWPKCPDYIPGGKRCPRKERVRRMRRKGWAILIGFSVSLVATAAAVAATIHP